MIYSMKSITKIFNFSILTVLILFLAISIFPVFAVNPNLPSVDTSAITNPKINTPNNADLSGNIPLNTHLSFQKLGSYQSSVVSSSYVQPYGGLTASFSASPLNGALPLTVKFTDTSTGSPNSWKWSFGDGKTSTQKNPTNVYNKIGSYSVQLTVKKGLGSSTANKPNYITVNSAPSPGSQLKVFFLNVGQGDSILLQNGDASMLVDAGPSESGKTIVNFIKGQKISKLNYIVASHPHEDHIGGMVEVLKSYKPGTYIDNGETTTTKTYKDLMKKLVADKTPYSSVKAGKTFSLGDSKVEVLGPSKLTGDLNQDSVVLRVTKNEVSFLLTGDSEDASGLATILKVPHHGSKNSVKNLQKINPKAAVIEVGKGNTYGHPDASTLSILKKANVPTYRTDLNGNIISLTDGKTWTITPSSNPTPTPTPTPIPTITPKPTPTPSAICDCSGDRYNCKDFPLANGATAQQCYDYCMKKTGKDIHRLDGDKDGLACES